MISGNPPSSPGTPPSLSFMADCHTAMVIILLDFIDPDFEFRSWGPFILRIPEVEGYE